MAQANERSRCKRHTFKLLDGRWTLIQPHRHHLPVPVYQIGSQTTDMCYTVVIPVESCPRGHPLKAMPAWRQCQAQIDRVADDDMARWRICPRQNDQKECFLFLEKHEASGLSISCPCCSRIQRRAPHEEIKTIVDYHKADLIETAKDGFGGDYRNLIYVGPLSKSEQDASDRARLDVARALVLTGSLSPNRDLLIWRQ